MRILVILALLACSGCSVTMTGAARWSDQEPVVSEDAELRKQIDSIKAEVQAFVGELRNAPNDIDAINAVLKKYGIVKE